MIKPVSKHNRYTELDALRGFALFGILLANLYSFMGYNTYSPTEITTLPTADRSVLFMIDWFVEGKFYSIFSMLFGMGFALQAIRMEKSQDIFTAYWSRRMRLLLCIGLFHMFLVWHGDILTLYSLMGMLLILFTNFSKRALLYTSIFLLTFPIFNHLLVSFTQDASFWSLLSDKSNNWRQELGLGDFSLLELRTSDNADEVFLINVLRAITRPIGYLMSARPAGVLGMFLLGMFLIKSWNDSGNFGQLKKWPIFFIIGCVTSFGYAWTKYVSGTPYALDDFGFIQSVIYNISAPCFALGIVGAFFHYWKNEKIQKLMTFFTPLGRMALTNYLVQNSLAVMIFFGYGLALMRQIPFAYIPVIASLILLAQWVFSAYWLSRYRQGPLEYLWRKYAYRDY
ncbi:DUF418 domain-containing protein [Pseudemcibacter aquimaris]|uniref:DUF418 domain-containing protein n=1 Tax=Pseudemcibacter aquimaris TaxID=2857064 RepID=UPI0020137AF5|nr:DUF418 domain-containing protein [Pseudemcibacter aquimaris]MCC3861404.1 DUF418 domain-containing protein [Pseudemcibacter aquimaris]WDU58174.1 DUF418 domain-containing protein [Pseudemcibacter aquimaris]